MTSKAIVGIIGPSGSGKSSCLRNLDPETTAIMDVERKGFPFPRSTRFKHIIPITSCAMLETEIAKAIKNPDIKLIIVDSLTKFLEMLKKMATECYKGYEIWNYYNKKIRDLLDNSKNDRVIVVFTGIDEIVKLPLPDGSEQSVRRLWVQGKEHEGKIEKEFLLVFFTETKRNAQTGKMEYFFRTNTDGITSAKSPMGMFDKELIENDLNAALARAREWALDDVKPEVVTETQP